jgi:drug/metabolite transporter (DMT)-like permease
MSSAAEQRQAVGQLLLAALFWSLGGLLIKATDWPPLAVAGGRGLIAAAFLALVTRELRFHFGLVPLTAAVAYAACTVLFVAATKLTTAANAILLQYSAPIWIALLGTWFLGERASPADWLTIAVVLAGMALFFAEELAWAGLVGNLVAVLSGVCFAVMIVALRGQKDGSPVESIILGNLLAGIVGLPSMAAAGMPSSRGLAAIALLGVVQLGCSYWLYARAIRRVPALEAVIITAIEPILNPVWVFLVQGERPSRWAILGGLLIVSAVTERAVRASARPAPV